jgi:Uma2 family endonuclease
MTEMVKVERKLPPQGKVSFDEFLAWVDEDTRAEWEDGEIIMASPASRRHQDLNDWLTTILRIYVRHRKSGWLSSAPFLNQLQVSQQGREPDLIFLKTENIDRLQETYLVGAPDLIVEIISLESISRDRGRKFVEYESEGVPEYWLIDPIRKEMEFYQLGLDHHYHLSLPDAEGIYNSAGITGFWLKVSWLWEEPLPDELTVLRELGVLE